MYWDKSGGGMRAGARGQSRSCRARGLEFASLRLTAHHSRTRQQWQAALLQTVSTPCALPRPLRLCEAPAVAADRGTPSPRRLRPRARVFPRRTSHPHRPRESACGAARVYQHICGRSRGISARDVRREALGQSSLLPRRRPTRDWPQPVSHLTAPCSAARAHHGGSRARLGRRGGDARRSRRGGVRRRDGSVQDSPTPSGTGATGCTRAPTSCANERTLAPAGNRH